MASPESGRLCCLRCGKPVGSQPSARPHPDSAPTEPDREAPQPADNQVAADATGHPSGYDGWELDEELRHMGRLLGATSRPVADTRVASGRKHRRIDAAHATSSGPHYGRRPARTAADEDVDLGGFLLGAATWTMLTLGLMASTCGGVLLIWSAAVRRDDLWSVGLPIALVGLLALVVAMVLQLDRISGDHRQTVAKLERFDSRLVQLRRDAAISAADMRPACSPFYAHMAEGASPELLLTDLKSQLELLSKRLGRSDAAGE